MEERQEILKEKDKNEKNEKGKDPFGAVDDFMPIGAPWKGSSK